jgi:hypothetical protein
MTEDKVPLIVVDAANVVGSRPDGWWRDRAGAARRLLNRLTALATSAAQTTPVAPAQSGGHSRGLTGPIELAVVLEGAARAAADPGVVDGLRVVHASGSGDDEIAAVVAAVARADPRRAIVVVTADRGLRERVEAYGATTVGPRWLEWRLGEG